MKLDITKGHINILANPNNTDIEMVYNVAVKMTRDKWTDINVVSSGSNEEYFITLCYDSTFTTVNDIKELYKEVKESLTNTSILI